MTHFLLGIVFLISSIFLSQDKPCCNLWQYKTTFQLADSLVLFSQRKTCSKSKQKKRESITSLAHSNYQHSVITGQYVTLFFLFQESKKETISHILNTAVYEKLFCLSISFSKLQLLLSIHNFCMSKGLHSVPSKSFLTCVSCSVWRPFRRSRSFSSHRASQSVLGLYQNMGLLLLRSRTLHFTFLN